MSLRPPAEMLGLDRRPFATFCKCMRPKSRTDKLSFFLTPTVALPMRPTIPALTVVLGRLQSN